MEASLVPAREATSDLCEWMHTDLCKNAHIESNSVAGTRPGWNPTTPQCKKVPTLRRPKHNTRPEESYITLFDEKDYINHNSENSFSAIGNGLVSNTSVSGIRNGRVEVLLTERK